jgi:hypothetical protein
LQSQGRNIFEISDEVWGRDEVLVAHQSRLGPDLVDCAPRPNALDGDRPGEESRRDEVLRSSLLVEDPIGRESARRSSILGPLVAAGVLLLGAGAVIHHKPEGPPAQASVEPTAPRSQGAPSVPARKAERLIGERAGRARNSAGASSNAGARPTRSGRVTPRVISPRPAAPTRRPRPSEMLDHEFSFER